MSEYTVGDDQSVECPACGKDMSTRDLSTDGCLERGFEDECEHCGVRWGMRVVDWEPTVYVEAAPAQKGGGE